MKTIPAVVVGLSLMAAATVFGQQGERPAPTVGVAKPVTVAEGEPRTYVGTVKASEKVGVTARITGEIWKQNFKEGAVVEKDQVLFEIEDTVYKANLKSAKARLASLKAQLAFSEKEVVRYKECLAKHSVPQSDYDRQVQTRDMLLADIDAAEAAIALAENDLKYTTVKSPIKGQIGETKIRLGNNVSPQSGDLVTIVQFDPIQLQFALSEYDYFKAFDGQNLKGNMKMELIRADGRTIDRAVKIDFVDNQVDRSTGTVMVQLECPNADRALIPGGYVKVLLSEVFKPAKLAVKVSAVQFEGTKRYVYVAGANSVAERREIKTGAQIGDLQLVESGLKADDRVVVTGTHKVVVGQPVNGIDQDAPQASAK